MSPSMSWVAIGLGLLVLWQIIAHWPSEVTERDGLSGSSAVRAGLVREAGLPSRSLTSLTDDPAVATSIRAGAAVFDWDVDGFGDAA